MQTFLPYASFGMSVACLDTKRLGKQRLEAKQLLNAIENLRIGKHSGWQKHPACLMWVGYENALRLYHNFCIMEWCGRGWKNTMEVIPITKGSSQVVWDERIDGELPMPPWVGDDAFHRSHQSNLLRKDPIYYGKFKWDVGPDLPYVWPKV